VNKNHIILPITCLPDDAYLITGRKKT